MRWMINCTPSVVFKANQLSPSHTEMVAHPYWQKWHAIHKSPTGPLWIRKHYYVALLARPLKCNPTNHINFVVFIAPLLLAYIKEIIISGHFVLLCFVLHKGVRPLGVQQNIPVFPPCCAKLLLHPGIPSPSLCASVCHVHLCFPSPYACATYARCNPVR